MPQDNNTQQPAVTTTPAPVADMSNVTTPEPVKVGTDVTPGPAPVAAPGSVTTPSQPE